MLILLPPLKIWDKGIVQQNGQENIQSNLSAWLQDPKKTKFWACLYSFMMQHGTAQKDKHGKQWKNNNTDTTTLHPEHDTWQWPRIWTTEMLAT